MALFRILALTVVVFLVTRWLRRALSGRDGGLLRSPSGKPWFEPTKKVPDQDRPVLRTLYFRNDPREVLGLDRGASADEIAEAHHRLIAENHPDKVADMSEEIRLVAARKTEEINQALAALIEE